MAHSLKEREFLVDKAIELEIFKTMEFDKKIIQVKNLMISLMR